MKRFIPFIMLLMSAPLAARADITTRYASSVQLSVGGAHTSAERIGSSFSISGSGVDTTDCTTANTISAGTVTSGVYAPGTISATQDVPGATFSFSQAYTQADAVPTSAVTVGETANFGNVTSTAGGTVGNLAGQTSSSHAFSAVAPGGANTSATTQFVTEVTVR